MSGSDAAVTGAGAGAADYKRPPLLKLAGPWLQLSEAPGRVSVPKAYRTLPCRHWDNGMCRHGDRCTYIHAPERKGSMLGGAEIGRSERDSVESVRAQGAQDKLIIRRPTSKPLSAKAVEFIPKGATDDLGVSRGLIGLRQPLIVAGAPMTSLWSSPHMDDDAQVSAASNNVDLQQWSMSDSDDSDSAASWPSSISGVSGGTWSRSPSMERKHALAAPPPSTSQRLAVISIRGSQVVDPFASTLHESYRGMCFLCRKQFNSRSQEQHHTSGQDHRNRTRLWEVNELVRSTPYVRKACFNCHQPGHQQINCSHLCRAFANRKGCKFGRGCRLDHVRIERL